MTRLVFLDTETTSLDDTRGEVWEIGAIVRDPGEDDVEYCWQLRPDLATADPMSLRIGRYYERMDPLVRAFPKVVAYDLARLLDGAHVVGGVPDFDFRFLRKFLKEHGQCWTAHYHLIDMETLAVGYLHGLAIGNHGIPMPPLPMPWKSTDLYRAIGIDPSAYEAHTALGDARLVRDVWDKIVPPIAVPQAA